MALFATPSSLPLLAKSGLFRLRSHVPPSPARKKWLVSLTLFVKQKRSGTSTVSRLKDGQFETTFLTGIPDSGDSGGPLFCKDAAGLAAIAGTTAFHTDGEGLDRKKEWFMTAEWGTEWIEASLRARGEPWPPRQMQSPADPWMLDWTRLRPIRPRHRPRSPQAVVAPFKRAAQGPRPR